MSIFDTIGLVAGTASIAAFIYAIFYARQSRRIKFLVYEISDPVPLASAVSPEDDYRLSVTFQHTGLPEERIKSVYMRFLRFVNLGREPIRRDDVAQANPMRITIEDVRTLDITLAGITRPVNKVALTNQSLSERTSSADVTFDFLDYKDGALVKILTVGGDGTLSLSGDIIGMPDGIKKSDEVGSQSLLNKIGTALGGLLVFSAFVLSIVSFYWVTGSWNNIWLLALPFVALIVPAIIVAIIGATIWPSQRPFFPASLAIPRWFRTLALYHQRLPRYSEGPGTADDESKMINFEM